MSSLIIATKNSGFKSFSAGFSIFVFDFSVDFMEKQYDFLVIGSGLGGLSFALKVAEHGKVCLITKSELEETNTRYAQGGIAAVTYEPDSHEKHVVDNELCIQCDGCRQVCPENAVITR